MVHVGDAVGSMLHSFLFLLVLLSLTTDAYVFPSGILGSSCSNGRSLCAMKVGIGRSPSMSNLHLQGGSSSMLKGHEQHLDITESSNLGVLLLNLGGPEVEADVEGFLYNLFADPDIIRLPKFLGFLQKPLAKLISNRRAPKSSAAYRSIGGGSPIVAYTREQASLLQGKLAKHLASPSVKGAPKTPPKVYFAMRYWHPFTDKVVQQMKEDSIDRLIVLPLYPQYSLSTSASSLRELDKCLKEELSTATKSAQEEGTPNDNWGENLQLTVIPHWFERKGYIDTMAKLILEQLDTIEPKARGAEQGIHVLYSAHGVPESYIAGGDPYQGQMENCVSLISNRVAESLASEEARREVGLRADYGISLEEGREMVAAGIAVSGIRDPQNGEGALTKAPSSAKKGNIVFHLSFQSRVGPIQWIKPYTEKRIEEMGADGVKTLVVVPVSFVSEHIETLEEIDMEYRELAEENGIHDWKRVPALNTDDAFITDMCEVVTETILKPIKSIDEAMAENQLSKYCPFKCPIRKGRLYKALKRGK